MYSNSVDNYSHPLEFVSVCYKAKKMCDKAGNTYPSIKNFVPECQNAKKKCVTKRPIDALLYFSLFLINTKLKKCVTESFLKMIFEFHTALINS